MQILYFSGVYVPTLSQKIVELINSNSLNLNFKGFAVGNGILSNSRQVDSYVDLSYYRGIIGKQQFDYIKSCCPYQLEPAQICNYTSTYLTFDYTNGFYVPKNSTDPKFIACANTIAAIGQDNMWESEIYADVYNFIQSCYVTSEGFQDGLKDYMKVEKVRSLLSKFTDSPIVSDGYSSFVDQGAKINTKSTDPFAGYRCYSNDAMIKYLNTPEVKKAINIQTTSPAWNITWVDCA
uniref:Uncharacterized protein n=1 Tax=Panagrolaimus davidi TaxID=227884 RepID=A0A914QPG0_9BILA